MLRLANNLNQYKRAYRILYQISQSFSQKISHSEEEDYFPEEIVDPLYETQLQEEFGKLYTTGYRYEERIPGFATQEGTQRYSTRSNSSLFLYNVSHLFS